MSIKEPQQVMDFSLFLLALYLLWDNFLISEMTSIHMNNLSLCILWPKMKALRSTETSVTHHQSTGRNLHQHLCENVMSHRLGYRAGPSY
jgi:hypothetical protein